MSGALRVTDRVHIPRDELHVRATRAGGAGGQHVNTSSTRIEVLWRVRTTLVLDDEERARVMAKLASRLDGDGWLRVVSSSRRSQRQNRDAAEARLAELVRRALHVRKARVPTRPTRGAVERRLEEKHRHSEAKRRRRPRADD
jgi:ribosome-associated protein